MIADDLIRELDRSLQAARAALDKFRRLRPCQARGCSNVFLPPFAKQIYCSKRCVAREMKAQYRARKRGAKKKS